MIPMPPENIRRISVFGLGHRFLPGTRNSHFSRPVTPIIKWGHETKIIDIDWLWKPFIPYSKVTIIEGDGGDGKTTMILTIAAMLSQGIQPPALVRGHL